MKIDDINRNKNNFDLLRYIAASLVIFSHSYVLSLGNDEKEPFYLLTQSMTFGKLSVCIFFMISGYLITKSWNKNPNIFAYSWKRILRIYPGLIVSILFSTFVIGPLVSSLDPLEYFKNIDIPSVLIYMATLRQKYLPGVFSQNIYPDSVNGSLWTLIGEATMYIVTAIIGLLGIFKKKWLLFVFILAEIILYNIGIHHLNENEIRYIYIIFNVDNVTYYLIGACFYLYEDKIQYRKDVFIFALILWIISFDTEFFKTISYISIPYIIFHLAFIPTKYLKTLTERGDFSYGLYIYAFPIQQTFVHLFQNNITPLKLFILSYPITFLLAFFSWNLVEKRALELKNIPYFSNLSFTQKLNRKHKGD